MFPMPALTRLFIPHVRRTLAVGLFGVAAAGVAAAAEPAAYPAAMRMGSIPYRQVSMPVTVVYPGTNAESPRDLGPFRMSVAMGAPVAKTPQAAWPVVFVSHGTGGSVLGHADLLAALARAGYVAIALEHPGDNYRDRSLVGDDRYFAERPAQLKALIGAFLDRQEAAGSAASSLLADIRLDAGRVAVIGHSAGGHTAAVVSGAQADVRRVAAHCQRFERDDPMCALGDPRVGVAPGMGGPRFELSRDAVMPASLREARIKATVLLAPLTVALVPASVAPVSSSWMVIGAKQDEVLLPRFHLDPWQTMAPGAMLINDPRAGHYSFMTSLPAERRAMLGDAGNDPKGLDRAGFQRTLAVQILDFLKRTGI